MPTYEYECASCHRHSEAFQRMSDSPLRTCPKCHGRLRRLVSGGSGLIFKGSGFYITDYARKGTKTSEESSTTAAKDEMPKPAAKATPKTADKAAE
jgi:putative FmdB family regulatory protein